MIRQNLPLCQGIWTGPPHTGGDSWPNGYISCPHRWHDIRIFCTPMAVEAELQRKLPSPVTDTFHS
eukprot:2304120-Pyramimonas_sp.AAC.1